MIRNKVLRVLFVLWILFTIVLNVGPAILRALSYTVYTSIPEGSVQTVQPSSSAPSFTVDSNGHKHWIVTVYQPMIISESVTLVRHSYILGLATSWLDALSAVETLRDIYDIMMMPFVLCAILLLFSHRSRSSPIWINR
jgi:hypothetical protein